MKRLQFIRVLFPLGIRMRSAVMLLVFVVALITSLILESQFSYAAVGISRPDGDITKTFANCTGGVCPSGYYAAVNESSLDTSNYVSTGSSGGEGDEVEFSMSSVAGVDGTVSQVAVKFQAHSNPAGSSLDTLAVRIFIDGSYQSAQVVTMTTVSTLYTVTFNGSWSGDDDLQVEFVRSAVGGGSPSSRDDNVVIYQVYADITYAPNIAFEQSAYRWFQNQNSANVGSPLAAQDGPASFSTVGQDFRLRTAVHTSVDNLPKDGQRFSLQYVDKGTGTCQLPVGGAPSAYANVGFGGEWQSPMWGNRSGFQAVEFDGKMWVIGGFSGFSAIGSYADVWYSTDGSNWTLATDQPGWAGRQQHVVAVLNNKLYVIGGYDGTNALSDVWSSSDGINWTEETSNAAFGGRYQSAGVGFGGKLWLFGGYNGSSNVNSVWSSSDGKTWTQAANPPWSARAFHEATVFNGKMWVMGGTNGFLNYNDVHSSTNGTSWTLETSSANWSKRQTFGLAVADGKMWVLGGFDGARINDVWSSTNGTSWTRATASADWDARSYHEAVGHDNKVWVVGGHDGSSARGDVWSSIDGSAWTSVVGEVGRRRGSMSTVFNGEMWIVGGASPTNAFLRDVYKSSDGVNWTKVTNSASWPGRMGGVLLSFNSKLWLMGGWNGVRLNDVWSSSDGITWTQETSSAGWEIRNYPSAMVFGGKMWLMGGLGGTGSTRYNDVWSSTDGTTWTQETSSAGWSARYGAYGATFNGKMYIVGGGASSANTYNDVWSSTDGATWVQEASSADWSPRLQHSGTVFDGKMWIYGGRDGSDSLASYNDLWSSSDGVNWVKENSSVLTAARYLMPMMGYNGQLWMVGGEDSVLGTVAEAVYVNESLITWNDNSTPANGAALIDNANDPQHASDANVNQSYVEDNGFTNSEAAINSGQDGLWDFSLKDNGAKLDSTYCFRIIRSSGAPLTTYTSYPEITFSESASPPNTPSLLSQIKVTGESTLGTGGWTNENQIKFTASASSPNSGSSLQLCVEYQPVGTGFTNTETTCGSAATYSGTPVSAEVTASGLSEANYHWQARVKDADNNYSDWVSYGANAESARDFGVDTTPPNGVAYDGANPGSDAMFNSGALDSLSANWASNAGISGIFGYEYAIGTTAGGTDITNWTNVGTNTSVTKNSLSLVTSQLYFFSVRITDNAGNTTTVNTNGAMVAPTLTFSVSTNTIDFDTLSASNNYTASQSVTLSTTTNARGGYKIYGKATDFLKSQSLQIIPMFNGGTYASPAAWGLSTGLGYHSSDTGVGGVNRFNSPTCLGGGTAPCFAPYSTAGLGQVVADGSTPATDDQYTITTKVSIDAPNQRAGKYQTTILYSAYATY